MALLGAFAPGHMPAAPVCSDAPGDGDWILCEESGASNVEIEADGITIGTTGDDDGGVHGRHTGPGDIEISVGSGDPDPQNPGLRKPSTIATGGDRAHGVYGEHGGDSGAVVMNIGDAESRTTIATGGNDAHGARGHRSGGSGLVQVNVRNVQITTEGTFSDGVNGRHQGSGKFKASVRDSSIVTRGRGAAGIFGDHHQSGDIEIDVRDTAIATESTAVNNQGRTTAHGIWGWMRNSAGTGNIAIDVQGGSIKTAGTDSNTIYGRHHGDGRIDIDVTGGLFETAGTVSHSIVGQHLGTGDVEMNVQGASVVTAGRQAYGILGWTQRDGNVDLSIRNTAITTDSTAVASNGRTSAHGIFGVVQGAANTGTLTIDVQGSSIKTAGVASNGVYGWNRGSGNIDIDVRGGSIETAGMASFGIYGLHQGSGDIEITTGGGHTVTTTGSNAAGVVAYHYGPAPARRMTVTIGGTVDARGAGAQGVRVGNLSDEGTVVGAATLDAEGLRQQTVIVNGRVHGGSGANGAGIFLAGGGRVVIGPTGSVGAASGIAILATGDVPPPDPNPDNIQVVKPRLRVDMNLANRRVAEVIGNNWIINDGGGTTIYVNNVKLHDADTGITGLSAPNGARNVRIRAEGVRVIDRTTDPWVISDPAAGVIADRDFSATDFEKPGMFIEEYAPRAAVYETLPGFLLRLDAGVEEERSAWAGSPVWARLSGGRGSYTPDRASVGADFDFDRFSAEAGLDVSLGDNAKGSISVRVVQGSADVTSSVGGGKVEAEGLGVAFGASVNWPKAWYAKGRFSLTNYTLDLASGELGLLKEGVGARGRFLDLEAGRRTEVSETIALTPRA